MARPKNQTARREALISATMEAGSDLGLRSLSLTEVARRAGLTRGAVLYYFDDLNALILEAHEVGVRRLCTERDDLIAEVDDPAQKLSRAISAGLPRGADDSLMKMLYEFEMFATASSRHRELLIDLYRHQLATYERIIESGRESGVFSPFLATRLLAQTLVGLEDAYGLYITTGGDEVMTVDAARDAMVAVAAELGCEPIT